MMLFRMAGRRWRLTVSTTWTMWTTLRTLRTLTLRTLVGCGMVLALAGTAAAQDLRLVEAAKGQNAESVRLLLRQRADVNGRQPDGTTALHWAAYRDDLPMLSLLLGAGARVNTANELGVTP